MVPKAIKEPWALNHTRYQKCGFSPIPKKSERCIFAPGRQAKCKGLKEKKSEVANMKAFVDCVPEEDQSPNARRGLVYTRGPCRDPCHCPAYPDPWL